MDLGHQETNYDSGDDSDILEVAVVPPKRAGVNSSLNSPPIAKRRKSSPQMDPIPSYTPTPTHLLEAYKRQQQQQGGVSPASSSYYTATNESRNFDLEDGASNHDDNNHYLSPSSRNSSASSSGTSRSPPAVAVEANRSRSSNHKSSRRARADDEYVPLLGPDPIIEAYTCNLSPPRAAPPPTTRLEHASLTSITGSGVREATIKHTQARIERPRRANNPSAPRPVSSALAQAIAQKKKSRQEQQSHAARSKSSSNSGSTGPNPSHLYYAEKPVMWSPKLPSQIEPVKDEEAAKLTDDQPRGRKVRIAHKPPTIAKNKNNRPKVPLGAAKKVPISVRAKYLNVIIDEYLNTGHKEELAYEQALKDEQNLAGRAANKNIYANLVAGLKRKIRESAGISTKILDDDQHPKYVNGNKVVSHEEIITGKVIGTMSIERKRKSSDPSELNEQDLYDLLKRYVMPVNKLEDYGYPCSDPERPELRKVPLSKNGQKQTLRSKFADSYTCDRCMKVYRVDEDGMQLDTTNKCIFHSGHLWNERINRALEKRYSCCKGDASSGGCSSNPYHVHRGELELKNYQGYVETQAKPELDPNRHGLYALDCEMCYTTYGLELTRVTVINYKHDVVYEELVKPLNPILDYNTKYSGIKAGDLDQITKTLTDVQQDLLKIFSSKTILVGHSLDSDMKALRIFHKLFIDTANLFPHKRGLPFKRALRTLMVENLRVIIQDDSGHDSKEDAIAAFRLVMWKAKTDVPEKTS